MNWPKPRIEIEKMDPYKAPLEGRRNLLRLDFNENTIGPSPKVIDALNKIPSNHIAVYPEYSGIKEALINNLKAQSASICIKPNQIGLFNGVDAAINAIFHSYGNKKDFLLTTQPTFGYYIPCAEMQGMKTIAIQYQKEGFAFPFLEIQESLIKEKPKLLFICNPNNPTGTKISPRKIIELANIAPQTLIVVDELYEAFGGESLLPIINLKSNPNLLILRSLSKTAGLAGLRIGFAIGDQNVIDFITKVTGPYDINTFATTAAIAALKDQDYINSYVEEVLLARDWIRKQLIDEKIKFHIGGGNYLLIWPKKPTKVIENCLRNEGILIRDMSKKPLIDKSFRVSIGTLDQMKRFMSSFIKHEKN